MSETAARRTPADVVAAALLATKDGGVMDSVETQGDDERWAHEAATEAVFALARADLLSVDEDCNHDQTDRVRKHDGGRRPVLCGWCYTIVGRWSHSRETGYTETDEDV